MGYQSFKELRVWQAAKDFAIWIYQMTANGMLARDYGLKDQIQRAAVSVAANIAEGYEKPGNKDFIRFLFMAKGSFSELRTHLAIANGIGYIPEEMYSQAEKKCISIGSMLTNLIKERFMFYVLPK